MLRFLIESGIEFQIDTPIVVKDFHFSSFKEFDRETFFWR